MICSHCGRDYGEATYQFCLDCGRSLVDPGEAATVEIKQPELDKEPAQEPTAQPPVTNRYAWAIRVGYTVAPLIIGFAFFLYQSFPAYINSAIGIGLVGVILFVAIGSFDYIISKRADFVGVPVPIGNVTQKIKRWWKHVLFSALWLIMLLSLIYTFFTYFSSHNDAVTRIIGPTPTSTPTPKIEPDMPPAAAPNPRILTDGRIVVDISPEYFAELEKLDEYTSMQKTRMRQSYFDKWIMFSGTLNDVWSKPVNGELFVVIARGKTHQFTWFNDDAQKDAVQQLRKNDPITVLCKIEHAKGDETIIIHRSCELMK